MNPLQRIKNRWPWVRRRRLLDEIGRNNELRAACNRLGAENHRLWNLYTLCKPSLRHICNIVPVPEAIETHIVIDIPSFRFAMRWDWETRNPWTGDDLVATIINSTVTKWSAEVRDELARQICPLTQSMEAAE